MSKEQNSREEEIELGSLFIIIGKGFSNLFNFIGKLFKGVYHFLIIILLFIKLHLIKLVIAALIGGALGTVIEINKDTTFGADLQVQPNFKSARQLYNNINYYNDLVKQKDTVSLASTFKVSIKEAATLKKFEIYPIKNGNDVLTSYDELILSIDTLTAKSYSFNMFKNTFTDFDYKVHNIHVVATKNNLFSKLDEVIISSIVENKYFNKVKSLTNENLNRTDSLLRQNLIQIDSLRRVYMSVLVEESKKQNSSTNINLGESKLTTKELELFETNRKINEDLNEISIDKSEKSEVLNVISNFQPVGYEIKGIDKNYGVLAAGLGVLLMVFFLLLKQLNKHLDNFKK
mgnify:CR=1 FL=1